MHPRRTRLCPPFAALLVAHARAAPVLPRGFQGGGTCGRACLSGHTFLAATAPSSGCWPPCQAGTSLPSSPLRTWAPWTAVSTLWWVLPACVCRFLRGKALQDHQVGRPHSLLRAATLPRVRWTYAFCKAARGPPICLSYLNPYNRRACHAGDGQQQRDDPAAGE